MDDNAIISKLVAYFSDEVRERSLFKIYLNFPCNKRLLIHINTLFFMRETEVIRTQRDTIARLTFQAHASAERACRIAAVKYHVLTSDESNALRGLTLTEAIESDREKGLIPFYVSLRLETLGPIYWLSPIFVTSYIPNLLFCYCSVLPHLVQHKHVALISY